MVLLHTDIPSRSDIENLAAVRREPCISIYVPTTPITPENEPARIELRNAVDEAAKQLAEAGYARKEIETIAGQAEALGNDPRFWTYMSNSLAVFLTADDIRTFRLPNELTSAVEVSDRFYIKPLLRTVTFPHSGFVLALSQNSARLVEITADSPAVEVTVDGMPTSLEDAIGEVEDPNEPYARVASGDLEQDRMTRYARMVDRSLRSVLAAGDRPLILAAAEPLASIYRSVATAANLVEEGISGNPDAMDNSELSAAARTILDDLYDREVARVREDLLENFPRERVGFDLQQVARAATFGAVDTLLVDIDSHHPGYLDEADGHITVSETENARDYGIADEIARRALRTGARVLAVRDEDIPNDGPVAALLRYPI